MKTLIKWIEDNIDIDWCTPSLLITLGTMCLIWIPLLKGYVAVHVIFALIPIILHIFMFVMIVLHEIKLNKATYATMILIALIPLTYVCLYYC